MFEQTVIMKKSIVLLAAVIMISFISACSGMMKKKAIETDFEWIKKKIQRSRLNYTLLKKKKVGTRGFYYIIDTGGTVIYHPQSYLIGKNMKKYSFIREVIEKKRGCISYEMASRNHLIIFDLLTKNEILILAISGKEVEEYGRFCELKRWQRKNNVKPKILPKKE